MNIVAMVIRALVALSISLGSGAVSAMDLMELYREASANDARYAAAQAQFRVMRERVPQARAGVAPGVNLDSAYKRYEYHEKGGFSAFFEGRRSNDYRYGSGLPGPARR